MRWAGAVLQQQQPWSSGRAGVGVGAPGCPHCAWRPSTRRTLKQTHCPAHARPQMLREQDSGLRNASMRLRQSIKMML